MQRADLVAREHAARQHEQHHAAGVDVAAVVVVARPDLGGAPEGRAALAPEALLAVRGEARRRPEVRQDDGRPAPLVRHEQVLGLDVAVRHAAPVAVRDGAAEVPEEAARVRLGEVLRAREVAHEVAAGAERRQHQERVRRLEDAHEPEAPALAAEEPQDLDFAPNLLLRRRGPEHVVVADREALADALRREPRAVAPPAHGADDGVGSLAQLLARLVVDLQLDAAAVPDVGLVPVQVRRAAEAAHAAQEPHARRRGVRRFGLAVRQAHAARGPPVRH